MRLAIVSDIHANLPALEAVLADAESAGVDQLWCLGDVVGYGAHPDECASLIAERCALCLVGNHDLAVLGELDDSSFSPAAAAAVRWTRETAQARDDRVPARPASRPTRAARWPCTTPLHGTRSGSTCCGPIRPRSASPCRRHGSAWSATPTWLCSSSWPRTATRAAPARRSSSEDVAKGAQAGAGTRLDLSEGRWLINPGSVGQPRDGDPRAAWLELDTDAWEATYHRVEYEIDRAADAIAASELPEHLAKRLYVGQ